MSPILVRPVREQLEHDRVIRLLQAKYKRKFDVAINPGNEQTAAVGTGPSAWYPDLVLQSSERGRKLLGIVEVETSESVNNLEAMSQWASLARLRAPFHLYVPAGSVDVARRLCTDFQIPVAEIWAYHPLGDQLRFTLVHRSARADGKPRATEAAARQAAGAGRARRPASAARTARRAAPAGAAGRRKTSKAAPRAATRKAKTAARGKKPGRSGSRTAPTSSRAQKRK